MDTEDNFPVPPGLGRYIRMLLEPLDRRSVVGLRDDRVEVGQIFVDVLDCCRGVDDLLPERPVPALLISRSMVEKAAEIGYMVELDEAQFEAHVKRRQELGYAQEFEVGKARLKALRSWSGAKPDDHEVAIERTVAEVNAAEQRMWSAAADRQLAASAARSLPKLNRTHEIAARLPRTYPHYLRAGSAAHGFQNTLWQRRQPDLIDGHSTLVVDLSTVDLVSLVETLASAALIYAEQRVASFYNEREIIPGFADRFEGWRS